VERHQLNRLLEAYRPLLDNCVDSSPDTIEVSALGTMLQSFYNGAENIFKRDALELDGELPRGDSWHRDLLESMTRHSKNRPALISLALRDRLKDYLHFRHVFRSAYGFLLDWAKMAPLVLKLDSTRRMLETELEAFLASESSGH